MRGEVSRRGERHREERGEGRLIKKSGYSGLRRISTATTNVPQPILATEKGASVHET